MRNDSPPSSPESAITGGPAAQVDARDGKVLPLSLATGLILDEKSLACYPVPLAVVEHDGQIISANSLFSATAGLLAADGGRLAPAVLDSVGAASESGQSVRCHLDDGSVSNIFDLTVIPLSGPRPLLLILASEAAFEVGLRQALIESRARYMDLVAISCEAAWETDENGLFGTVTAGGMAGYELRQIIGRSPDFLLDPNHTAPTILPFRTPVPLNAAELWLRHADGHSVCFEISAVPLFDKEGVWRGARGVCRDVTEDRRNRVYLAELRSNERLFFRIVELFRKHSNPGDMLTAAGDACLQGFDASGCQIVAIGDAPAGQDPVVSPIVSVGQCGTVESRVLTSLDMTGGDGKIIESDDSSLLIAPAIYGGGQCGALILWRYRPKEPWNAREKLLISTLAGQLAVVIRQHNEYHKLLNTSRTDPLTDLLNRRAFDEELERRWQRLTRDRIGGALFFFDLDNFKLVNDRRGHEKGDEALRHVADILRGNTRGGDLLCRRGGDEFAVWLDAVDRTDAMKRAKVFLAAGKALGAYSGSAKEPLQFSIGVAIYDPDSDESVAGLVKRADKAMYEVKRRGKGDFAIAAPFGAFLSE